MAVDTKKLWRVGMAGANNLFMYVSTDAIATVVGANYFGTVAKDHQMRDGDVIIVVDMNANTVDMITVTAVSYTAETNTVVNGT